MKATASLQRIKGVFPSIHQPLPLTPSQSQRLLDALKTSFRKTLDREHGYYGRDATSAPIASSLSNLSGSRANKAGGGGGAAAASSLEPRVVSRPTDQHVRAILSHPVLQQQAQPSPVSALSRKKDPMDVFDRAVARGMMTLAAAEGCLRAKYNDVVQSSASSVREAMASSGAGSRVLQWLRDAQLDQPLDFLHPPRFITLLSSFLVAEGRSHVLWEWVDRVMFVESPTEENVAKARTLVDCLVRAHVQLDTATGENIDSALETMLHAHELLHQHPSILRRPWCLLSWFATVDAWRRPKPTAALYDPYLRMAQEFRYRLPVPMAHLQLLHPTEPDHGPAVRFLKGHKDLLLAESSKKSDASLLRLDSSLSLSLRPSLSGPLATQTSSSPGEKIRQRIFLLAMDTVQRLGQVNESEEAQQILQLFQEAKHTYHVPPHLQSLVGSNYSP